MVQLLFPAVPKKTLPCSACDTYDRCYAQSSVLRVLSFRMLMCHLTCSHKSHPRFPPSRPAQGIARCARPLLIICAAEIRKYVVFVFYVDRAKQLVILRYRAAS